MNARIASVLGAQLPSGAFPSLLSHDGTTSPDENGFVTALIALELLPFRGLDAVNAAVQRGMDFVERCAVDDAFAFYPRAAAPASIGELPPDADDTAVMVSLLLRTGRWPVSRAFRVIDGALERHRLHYRPESAAQWVCAGAYRTWLDARVTSNPVDCCVNANVAAMLRLTGRDGDGYTAAWRTVARATAWLAESPCLFDAAAPYYGRASELHDAIRRAVGAGVIELADALALLDAAPPAPAGDSAPLFRSLDGAFLWSAPLLHEARRLRPSSQSFTDKESS
jgi:hypothetical protein